MLKDQQDKAATLLAGIGIGAALMYFMDPQRGNARRAIAQDRAAGAARDVAWELDVARRDVRNRAQGVAAGVRNRLTHEEVEDEQLVERVRSELGHRADSLHRLDVTANAGTVTLRGSVRGADRDEVRSVVEHVRGVEHVVDELSTDMS